MVSHDFSRPTSTGDAGVSAAIKFVVRSGHGDCDCCGSYSWETVEVFRDGEMILFHQGDGHLGGGEWHSWQQAMQKILPALGFSVEVDEEFQGWDE